jgi:hypothetical protein
MMVGSMFGRGGQFAARLGQMARFFGPPPRIFPYGGGPGFAVEEPHYALFQYGGGAPYRRTPPPPPEEYQDFPNDVEPYEVTRFFVPKEHPSAFPRVFRGMRGSGFPVVNFGLRRSPWDHSLGQLPPEMMETPEEREKREADPDWATLITTGLTAGAGAYGAYTAAQIAEQQAEAARAKAEAERARAEAERAKVTAAQAGATAGVAAAAIPPGVLIVGGLGLAAAVVAAIVLS